MTGKLHLELSVDQQHNGRKASDFLAEASGLPKQRIKDAMTKGAVWLRRGRNRKRLRKVTEALKNGDSLMLFYDADLLSRVAEPPVCLHDARGYSVWFKPAGILSQGNDYGDHLSLLRLAEQILEPKRGAFPVHRLDRETAGLVLVAHKAGVAAQLSALFRDNQVDKTYLARVLGHTPDSGTIEARLDGKNARTHYVRVDYDPQNDIAELEVKIDTGRTHQIRRHLAGIGHPVIGDPRYGQGNKNRAGLQLWAKALAFTCPLRRQNASFELSPEFLAKNAHYTPLTSLNSCSENEVSTPEQTKKPA
ncbi:RluA family pseudouridine synthase [Marinobacterium mangrovicola]|uniref:tRNA pseudouridine32 synthase / 23S rRNA pseudouridine746 synthase n=1 Tax=Marinobacterium mangrovicola TaxID=1476959 RepID=A0A4R1GIM6_9GAMM|nr:RluA family pseudouridine synthase [Marinobacterium mangrovicola]TCK08157.1 tRNA pseudouridine32 synthase / 23S rRNA pseudouridine746 synthase [Marinobacterium mangrovicola]